MKKIKIVEWSEDVPDSKGKIHKKEANTLTLLSYLLSNTNSKNAPKGFDQFRMFSRINKAFKETEKEKENQTEPAYLRLEDSDYLFLKKLVEEEIPAGFAMVPGIEQAVDNFLNPDE